MTDCEQELRGRQDVPAEVVQRLRRAPFTSRVVEALALGETASLLDIGYATGTLLAEVGRRRPKAVLTGIDADPRMLERARRKLTSVGVPVTLIHAWTAASDAQ